MVGSVPESVRTVALEQHPPDMVLVHEAEDTALDIRKAMDVMEEGREYVCDGCESVSVGSSSYGSLRSSGSAGGPFGDGE